MFSHLTVVTAENFKEKGFKKNPDFLFVKNETVCEITYDEMADALISFPIAMIFRDEVPKLVILMSVLPEQNCFVSPDGRWLGGYVPHIIRSFPFTLYPDPDDTNNCLLCIETSAIRDIGGKDVQEIFTDDGIANASFQKFIEQWQSFRTNQALTNQALKSLVAADIFVEWELVVSAKDGEQSIGGIFRVDEEKLYNLPQETLANLSKSGALTIAYAQILSRRRIFNLRERVTEYTQYLSEKEKFQEQVTKTNEAGTITWGF